MVTYYERIREDYAAVTNKMGLRARCMNKNLLTVVVFVTAAAENVQVTIILHNPYSQKIVRLMTIIYGYVFSDCLLSVGSRTRA